MIEAIDSRELITLDGLGIHLQATYHKPQGKVHRARSNAGARSRIGVLFLNSLFLPRAATGDSAVYWAESIANLGYPSFRIDLPGLGDSDAPLNTALLDFVNAGGYASVISEKVKELVERFDLSGMVIVGHCAGAVSAIFASAESKECRGLVLLDPYFYLPQQLKNSKAWKRLVRWGASSRLGRVFSGAYDRLKVISLTLRRNQPPANANFPLLRSLNKTATNGLPILLLKAPGRKSPNAKPRVGEFNYLDYIVKQAGRKSQLTIQVVEETDHSFANRAGRARVRQYTENWLIESFPLDISEYSAHNLNIDPAKEKPIDYESRNGAFTVNTHRRI